MIFRWDPKKARSNRRKHQVEFNEAASVFGDVLSTTFPDPEHSLPGDERFVTIGTSVRGRILVVVHSEEADAIRIISARRATRTEREFYEENS